MESIIELSKNRVLGLKPIYKRYLFDRLPNNQRLVVVKGARGIGKTTLLLQYLKQYPNSIEKAVYISLDDIIFSKIDVVDFVDWFYKRDGEFIVMDEVHKYPEWSIAVKTIYDRYSDLKIFITGSSALHLRKGDADLSRRMIEFRLNELSFREYLAMRYDIIFPSYSLDEVINNHEKITPLIVSKIKPLRLFDEFVRIGSYPFILEGEDYYMQRISNIVNQILESDLPAIESVTFSTVIKLRKLLSIIAESVPFTPNITELSQKVGVTREQLYRFLYLLEKADIIYMLRKQSAGMSSMAKPEKIYLHNANLMEALTHTKTNSGCVRESFFINQLSAPYKVNFPSKGDFIVNDKFYFEVGGLNKKKKQINGVTNAYIVKDGIEHGANNTIPLWLFGFLY